MIVKICRRSSGSNTLMDGIDIPPLLKRIYLQRGVRNAEELQLGMDKLLDYRDLANVDSAAGLLSQAIMNDSRTTVVGDFDADGATGTALTVIAMRRLGARFVNFAMPDRFRDGRGLSKPLIGRILSVGCDVIVTVDGGISSHEGVVMARESGTKVLITDHHLPGEELPPADVIVNPNLRGCKFKSKNLSGVGVIFYLMLALRASLDRQDWFKSRNVYPPKMIDLIDLVALGTVADMVPLDTNNRILVHQGLKLIRSGCCRIGIRELIKISNLSEQDISVDDLSFSVVPRLNAAGRLNNMSLGVNLLVADSHEEAYSLSRRLNLLNRKRQKIASRMEEQALTMSGNAEPLPGQGSRSSLVMYHEDWHQGVIGILASRMKDTFRLPVIVFAPAENGILRGSGRSLPWLNMHELVQKISDSNPGLILEFGGHAMAVGLALKIDDLGRFSRIFEYILCEKVANQGMPEEVIWTDGELEPGEISADTARLLREGGPWGVGFPPPTFSGSFVILHQRLIGRRHLRMLLRMADDDKIISGVIFNRRHELTSVGDKVPVGMVYQLDLKNIDEAEIPQLLIRHVDPAGVTPHRPVMDFDRSGSPVSSDHQYRSDAKR